MDIYINCYLLHTDVIFFSINTFIWNSCAIFKVNSVLGHTILWYELFIFRLDGIYFVNKVKKVILYPPGNLFRLNSNLKFDNGVNSIIFFFFQNDNT